MQFQFLKKILPDAGSYSLGLYRLLYFGCLVIYFGFVSSLKRTLPQIDPTAFRPGIFSFFSNTLFDLGNMDTIYSIWIAALLFTSFGLFTPIMRVLSFLLGYWVLGTSFSNGVISHQDLPHFLVLLVFAISDCGKSFSLDSLFFKRYRNKLDWEYKLPIFLLRFIFVSIFFSATIAKIKNGALLWFLNGNVSDMFARAHVWFLGFPLRPLSAFNVFLVDHLWAAKISVLLVFVAEALSPILFLRKFRIPMLVVLLVFQFLGTFALYIDFLYSFIALYCFWIPFEGKNPWRINASNSRAHKNP